MKRGKLVSQSKKGQIWIETVIYTSIALLMIGFVLTYAKPKIEEFQDKAILEQSIKVIKEIDGIIKEIKIKGSGNQRLIETGIKKGSLKIDGENDKIIFEMESQYQYSELGRAVLDPFGGRIIALTEKTGGANKVSFTINYTAYNIDITYQEKNEFKTLNKAPTPYKLLISNNGKSSNNTIIDISLSGLN